MPVNQPTVYTNPKAPKQSIIVGRIIKILLLAGLIGVTAYYYRDIQAMVTKQPAIIPVVEKKTTLDEKMWIEKIAATLTTPAEKEATALINLANVQKNKKMQYTYYILAYEKLSTLYEQNKDEKYKTALATLRTQMKTFLATPQTDTDENTITGIWVIDLEKEQEIPLLPQKDAYTDLSFGNDATSPHPVRIIVYYGNGTSQESLITLMPKKM